MKSNSLFRCCVYAAICGLVSSSLAGCGGADKVSSNSGAETQVEQSSSTTSAKASSANSTADQNALAATQPTTSDSTADPSGSTVTTGNNLQGVWYGESVYDVDALNAKLSQLEPEQALKLQEMVNTFSTIVMAAEFRPDSVMELDMMIVTNGQQLRDRSVGTWNVVGKTDAGIKIETKEYKNQEQQPTDKVYVYQFIDDDHFQFIPDSISPDLRPFSPRIIFQRVEQPLDDAAVAEEQSKNKVIR